VVDFCDACGPHPSECPLYICAPCAISPPDSEILGQRHPTQDESIPEFVVSSAQRVGISANVTGAGHLTVAQLSFWSPKRLAWAFGCAKYGSDEEACLFWALKEKLRG